MFIDPGNGSTVYPGNVPNLTARLAATNPNISAYARNVSMYNRPTSTPIAGMPATTTPDIYTYMSMASVGQNTGVPLTPQSMLAIGQNTGGPSVNSPVYNPSLSQTQANTNPSRPMTSNGMPLAAGSDGNWVAGDAASAHETDGMSPPSDTSPDSLLGRIKTAEEAFLSTISQQQASMYVPTTTDEITGEQLYAMPTDPYLGVNPGYVPTNLPKKPPADASDEELMRYLNQLNSGVQISMYRASDPLDELNKMDMATLKSFKQSLIYLGVYPENSFVSMGQINNTDIEVMGSLMGAANINGTDYQEQLQFAIDGKKIYDAKVAAAGGGGGGGGGGTNTQVTYNQTSIAQARALLISVLTDSIGRYPTQSEVVRFLKILNSAESKSPVTTVSTSSGDATTTRVSQTSVDPERLAQQFAEDIGGGAPAQANATDRYMAALAGSLGGVNG